MYNKQKEFEPPKFGNLNFLLIQNFIFMSNALKVVKTLPAQEPAEKQVGNIREILEKQLSEINKRKRLADNRQIFLSKKTALLEFRKSIEEEKQNGSFDSSKFKISLASSHYREDDKISISNIDLILDFMDMLECKIDSYVVAIETELIG